ncbi:MAG: ABC transporter ATP-binding protein, partial [Sphaerospermopsis sp. SIO1G2]|nr:ABC transporter ATP-binding protein [Sphaerospermopsis sp. SIO1G2]
MTVVQLENLSQTYNGRHTAVRDLTLTIPAGQITALLGPSGCGKTTTLKMIAGLLEPTSGQVLFNGLDVTPIPAEKRSAVMAFQNHLLFPYMSVADNVGFGLKMRGVEKDLIQKKVNTLLKQVQLAGYGERRPSELSGGQQQRVSLARALITEPDVLLLDEPLSNLDAHLRDEMRELILWLQRDNELTTIFVTHDQEEAVILADQIALMFAGEVHQFAQPRDFYDRPATAEVARFFGNHNLLKGEMAENGRSRFVLQNGQASLQLAPEIAAQHPHTTQLTIRPEHIHIADDEMISAGENLI